jgi:hypothetical protein
MNVLYFAGGLLIGVAVMGLALTPYSAYALLFLPAIGAVAFGVVLEHDYKGN